MTQDLWNPDIVSVEELQSRAEALVGDIKNQPEVSQEEHDANKPGGEANPSTSAQGWLWYLTWLHRKQAGSPLSVVKDRPKGWGISEAEDLRDTLAEEPVYVPMSDDVTRGVYPKSDYAMNQLMLIDRALLFVLSGRVVLDAMDESPEMLHRLGLAIEAQADLERRFVWCATHPSADVPWPDDGLTDHDLPKWTRSIGGHDLSLVRAAYIEVNYRRLNVLAERTHAMSRAAGDKSTPEAFVAFMATELGVSSREAARRYSKGSLFATNFLKWEAMERAEKKAKEKR
ncbi:MAG: hypothetical protein ACO1Q7_12505 [Gemmatimonas sp.]